MPTPSFDGVQMFGLAPAIIPRANPNDLQWNVFPGINGREMLNLGSRGGQLIAIGLLADTSLAGLITQEALWRAYQANAVVSVLVDTAGVSWTNVVLVHFTPGEEIKPGPAGYLWSRTYQAVFEQIA